MDGDATGAGGGFHPLVPPPSGAGQDDPVALHRHGLELAAAANRLALSWLEQAVVQHAALTQRALGAVTEAARRMVAAEGSPARAEAVLDALSQAQALGLDTAREIAGLMHRIHCDTLALVRRASPGPPPD